MLSTYPYSPARLASVTRVEAEAADEPLSLADAKAYARIVHDDEDAALTALLRGLRDAIEQEYGVALTPQTITAVYTAPSAALSALSLPVLPHHAEGAAVVTSLEAQTGEDTESIDAADLRVVGTDLRRTDGTVLTGQTFTLVYEAGYGREDVPVPPRFLQALRQAFFDAYHDRGSIAVGTSITALPHHVRALLAQDRRVSV